ncbi:hypothetical protein BH11MYX2_BH11MYX2_09570 [soil metagenome]
MISTGVHRFAFFVVLAGACHDEEPYRHIPDPPSYTYASAPVGWPLPKPIGHIGRTQGPQVAVELGVRGPTLAPLRSARVWSASGNAVVDGTIADEAGHWALEVFDIDTGAHLWRDTVCQAAVVGVTEKTIVCAGESIRGISLGGARVWVSPFRFVAMSGTRVIVADTDAAVVLDAGSGKELARVAMPAGVPAVTVVASCDNELFAYVRDEGLKRIVDGKVVWTAKVAAGAIAACTGDSVLVRESDTVLTALSRAGGQRTGSVADARGWWPARDGSGRIEIANASGIAIWPRDLSAATAMAPGSMPGLGELIATRGDNRLVRATPETAVLLDTQGVAAFLPMPSRTAALGEHAIATGSWNGPEGLHPTLGDHVMATGSWNGPEGPHRIAIPERERRVLHLVQVSASVASPAPLRDLPALVEPSSIDLGVDGAPGDLGAVAMDPTDPSLVYVTAPSTTKTHTLIALDLRTKKERWRRADACGVGDLPTIAFADDTIACCASTADYSTVVAYSRTGQPRWTWHGRAATLKGGAGQLLAAYDNERLHLLDATRGVERSSLPDAHAAIIVDAQWGTIVVNAERGRLVARVERADFMSLWSLAIDGEVSCIQPTGDSVLVELADGDAYRVRARDGAVIPLPAIGVTWDADDDVLATLARSSPTYASTPDRAPVDRDAKPATKSAGKDDEPRPPRLWQPIPPPADAIATTQLTLFDPAGGVRARNDYALRLGERGIRGAPASPLVLYGPRVGGGRQVLVVDAMTGDPLRRVDLDANIRAAFSTVVDGMPITGAVVTNPLRLVLF